jgi:uncharacterized protein YjiS (DUF1127 family)
MSEAPVAQFDTEAGFRSAVDAAILAADRQISIFDRDLSRLCLDERDRVAALRSFVGSRRGNSIRIAVQNTRLIETKMPRLIALLRVFGHAIEIRRTPRELDRLSDSHVLTDNGVAVIRFHIDQPRGKLIVGDLVAVHPWLDRFGELWSSSAPCALGSALGL